MRVFEGVGFAAVLLERAVLWQADHTDAVVGVGAVSAAPCGLVGRSVWVWWEE